MNDKKKLTVYGTLAAIAVALAVFMAFNSMAAPKETISTDSSHIGDKGYK